MEQIVNLIVCFLMISTINRAYSYPTPSDILSGKEFLSLLMEPEIRSSRSNDGGSTDNQRSSVTARSQRGSHKFSQFYYDVEDEASILPIEALFTSQEDQGRSGSESYGYRNKPRPRIGKLLLGMTTTTEIAEEFEDSEVTVTESTIPTSETTESDTSESTIYTTELPSETDATYSSASSTVATTSTSHRPQNIVQQMHMKSSAKSRESMESVQLNEGDRTVDSKSYRSEFMIEESAPSMTRDDKESERGESSNIHRVVLPPGTEMARVQPVRGRMQRKQDPVAQLQTVIYHDKKNDNDQPHSVSYSFIGETAPTLKTWKDIDEEYLSKPKAQKNETMETASKPHQSEPAKVWSEPEKNYSEPAKIWSQPAKFYSEPAKFYSEPAKIYSKPAEIYSEPAKIYSKPSSYWLTAYDNPPPVVKMSTTTLKPIDEPKRTVFNELDKIPYDELNAPADNPNTIQNAIGKFVPKQTHDSSEKFNNKPTPDPTEIVDPYVEKHGTKAGAPTLVQALAPATGSANDSKVGYVVEGRDYKKYRVEEKTPDGFIVGEYGVLSHNDGNLRGVRYTADSDINPRLIYDALLKFLSL
ncbi:uncharacterized protein LOC129767985 [Toxorhynchites rutilus septentrionalis]|uniref:uncharacterized protein LOC129767985 n=1 Tax=Toxorhynchites rutilus septentrionalis TaxID=329112 RepID=UPI00247974E6|nr:uncharacterized protein LOC129767985 [Toxorhynchites rutilus septentrionalis]